MQTPRRATRPRPLARATARAMALLLPLQIGCSSQIPAPSVTSAPYAGPPIRLEDSPEETLAVMSSPGAGWQITLDRVAEAYGRRDAFVTIRRPNPRFIYSQNPVEQRLATTIPPGAPLALYARVLPFDAKARSQPYAPVLARGEQHR